MRNPRLLPDQIAGEVVLARCFNPHENPRSRGKVRPMVLWRREGGHWLAMGLTRKSSYDTTGQPRTPIPDPAALGLDGQGFLWSNRLTRISVIDVLCHLGWATDDMMELIDRQIGPSEEAA
jgi:hypothetical protein